MNSLDPAEMDQKTAFQTAAILALIWVISSWFMNISYSQLCADPHSSLFTAIQHFAQAFVINYSAMTGLNAYVKRKRTPRNT